MSSFTLTRIFRVVFFVCVSFGIILQAQATHIKAGDIKAVRSSSASLTYIFTLNLYTRPSSETGIPSNEATISFGDGKSATVGKSQTIYFDGTTENNIFIFTHTYSGPGFYKIGYQEVNRIASIINMSNSVGTPFYIEMALSISPTSGLNSSPVLTVPPLDKGVIGQIYTHNPGAYDPDGDSLAFSFYTPQSDQGVFVGNYKMPDQYGGNSTTGGTPFITINSISGDIVWNAPSSATNSGSLPRYYNIAIRIDEFRGGVRIGYVIRDMQIEIDDSPNKPPVLHMPSDTCIVAGTLLRDTITATHPLHHNIFIQSYSDGGVYTLVPPASYTVTNNNTPAPVSYFTWQTTCSQIREQPYDIVFRAQDVSTVDPKLTDVRSFLVYVKAPKPKNLVTTPLATGIKLDWDPYKTTVCANVSKIRIYRKECTSANFIPEPCDDGIPATSGYVFIKEVDASISTYTDPNLVPGVIYCYSIVATFPSPGKGQSYPSNESCGQIAVNVPMIAFASVTATDKVNGTIILKWFEPLDIIAPPSPPYSYEISIASSDAPNNYTVIDTILADTALANGGLNTTDKQYFFKTRVIGVMDYSPIQSTVVLTAAPLSNAALLSWNVSTVCNLDTIEIYRSINGAAYTKVATLLDKKKVGSYTDQGLSAFHNCDTLNYYALVKGRYCDPRLQGELYSLSPIRKVVPLDDTPPPAPVLTLKSCAPPYNLKVNDLLWNSVADKRCNTVKGYNLYYAPHSSQDLSLLAFLTDTTYIHNMVDSSLAGCYEVKAVNYLNIEGAASNRICIDNCVYYQLPNLVTRDNNGRNDIFQAFPIPLGVQVVRFTVFNRWGNQVYTYEGEPNINWRTVDGAQSLLTEGVYYYEAEVHYYRRLNPDNETETLKGWVHLLGDKEAPKK